MNNDCILFSAIGHNDPVSHRRDGAMLHICRHYHPSKVYLLYSKEMCEIRSSDNRFELAIADLNERCGLNIGCEAILKPELVDVQKFDEIADMMKAEVERIHSENPDKQLLFNVSSGTPAMKGALILLANLLPESYRIKVIQVDAPERSFKSKEEENKNSSEIIANQIKTNEDFSKDALNRSYPEPASNIYSEIVKKDVCAHIDAYDYSAALRQLEEIKSHGGKISNRVQILLEAANSRLNEADKSKLKRALNDDEKAMVFANLPEENLSDLSEYALWLQIKLKSHHLTDFIRGITPICYELPIKYLKCVLGKNINSIKKSIEKGDIFDDNKSDDPLYKECMEILNKRYYEYNNDRPLSSEILIELVRGMNADDNDVYDFEKLRNYEQQVRNKVAHTITKASKLLHQGDLGLTENWERICRLLKNTFKMNDETFSDYLESYDKMNSIIKYEVQKVIG